jgi:hypothetical protein
LGLWLFCSCSFLDVFVGVKECGGGTT